MRYTPHTDDEVRLMLDEIGAGSVDDLFRSIPAEVQNAAAGLDLPRSLSEMEAAAEARALAGDNYDPARVVSFLGGGAYDHYIPAAVDQLLLRSEFYTCYTPYQAEVSQGTLQAIYEYQSLIIQLTGMEIANASGYDGASVCADAALMAGAIKGKRPGILVSGALNPAYRRTVETYNSGGANEVCAVRIADGATDLKALEQALGDDVACVIVQNPNFFGVVENVAEIVRLTHEAGALVAVAGCPVALGVLTSPGEAGADIAVGEGQPLGVPLSFGGPYLGYFATRKSFKRQLPGRLVGMTEDSQGRAGYVLTLQTREQHIRREKATSNICTNQSLLALAATIHLSLLGKRGLRTVAELCLQKGHYLAGKISALKGWNLAWPDAPFFREFAVVPPMPPADVIAAMLEKNFLAGIDIGRLDPEHDGKLLLAVTEQRTKKQIDEFVGALKSL
ncbi:MAG: aminomethyl-transferring glycine dehydrogenase subunit GcvPA [Candidatus Glassbacteria bacterium]|nr:aminomethyl-transferring glycine dehydrogenase subunit GcvPA [Candidatus Glassbacteria bacterium]